MAKAKTKVLEKAPARSKTSKAATKTAAKSAKAAKVASGKVKTVAKPTAAKPAAKAPMIKTAAEAKAKPVAKAKAQDSIKTTQAPETMAIAKVSLKGVSEVKKGEPAPAAAAKPAKKTRASKKKEDGDDKPTQLGQKWSSLYRKAQEQETPSYNMRQTYEAKTSIMHKVLGWGYIMTNKNDRLEVLFKDGIRYLISNYKA
ncbi:MAG: hypothetical protein AB7N80_05200 [Bdellovibrionales bacterium]